MIAAITGRGHQWLPAPAWLAQQSPARDPLAVVIPVAVLIIVVVGAGLLIMHIRGRMLRKASDNATTGSWLDELRAMHRRGEVSDQEYQAARASLLARVTGAPIPPPSRPADPSARIAPPGFDLTGAPLPPPPTDPDNPSTPSPSSPR